MKNSLLFLFIFLPLSIFAGDRLHNKNSGLFSLGFRNTVSAFSEDGATGFGYGAQFRLQLTDRINSEWFLDYITTNIQDLAQRRDYHIGWSIMYYLRKKEDFQPLVMPYIVAGHCFDYTRLHDLSNKIEPKKRFSAATQAGIGAHINLSPKFDITVSGKYMLHLGGDLHAHIEEKRLEEFEKHKGFSPEGHLLIHISLNYKIADLW